jgi:hemoglobin
MTWAFGGPAEYKGRDLRTAHAGLVRTQGLSDLHFDAVVEHLRSTLIELGVPAELVKESLQIVGGTRNEVLGR